MKYPIVQRFLPANTARRPATLQPSTGFMVAHDTGNPGSTAAQNVSYYERTAKEASQSAHLFVDDKEIIECVPFLTAAPERAWHVLYNVPDDNKRFGDDANDIAGGVELCYGGGINNQEAYKRYVWVFAYACHKFGMDPLTDIVGHFMLDPTRRRDPQYGLYMVGKTFADFLNDVVAEYDDCTEELEAMRREFNPDAGLTILRTWLKPDWDAAHARGDEEQKKNIAWLGQQLRAAFDLPPDAE